MYSFVQKVFQTLRQVPNKDKGEQDVAPALEGFSDCKNILVRRALNLKSETWL